MLQYKNIPLHVKKRPTFEMSKIKVLKIPSVSVTYCVIYCYILYY